MAFIEADYLTDVIGKVTELDVLGWIVYCPKLDRNIILSSDMYTALDEQELEASKNEVRAAAKALSILEDLEKRSSKPKEERDKKENGL